MWLLNVNSGELEDFIGDDLPDYAILSHTWGADEVNFRDIRKSIPSAKAKAGYRKIELTCNQAREDGIGYVWIDTCCIDKRSSAELSEAINSMYRWYEQARCCYAFLSDLTTTSPLDLQGCRWFKRGWTLQELLAPLKVGFYNNDWAYIGDKCELHEHITAATGISLEVLDKSRRLSSLSVAKRMSWMAHRETTRIEDKAYCLLGIFDVNMTLLYGERTASFSRLQEEILQKSDDQSIFAWSIPGANSEDRYGMFAPSPSAFAESGSIESFHDWRNLSRASITSSGLSIQLNMHQKQNHPDGYAKLNCWSEKWPGSDNEQRSDARRQVWIVLLQVPGTTTYYNRIAVNDIWQNQPAPEDGLPVEFRQIHVRQAHIVPSPNDINQAMYFTFTKVRKTASCRCIGLVYWDEQGSIDYLSVFNFYTSGFDMAQGKPLHCALIFAISPAYQRDAKVDALEKGYPTSFNPCGFAMLFGWGRSRGTIGYKFRWLDSSSFPYGEKISIDATPPLHFSHLAGLYEPENVVGPNHSPKFGIPSGMVLSFGISVDSMQQVQTISVNVDYKGPGK